MHTSDTISKMVEIERHTALNFFNACTGDFIDPLLAIRTQRKVIDASLQSPGIWEGSIRREYRRNKTYPAVNSGLETAFNKVVNGLNELATLPAELRLMQIHKWITGNDAFRKQGVRIGPYTEFPCACELSRLIPEMFRNHESSFADPVEIAANVHLDILMIHPFSDGNGRTARMLATYYLLQAGYKSILFTAVEQHFVYDPVQYTRVLQGSRDKSINRQQMIQFLLRSMMLNSWYAAWFRQRQLKVTATLEKAGLSKKEAIRTLTEIDMGSYKGKPKIIYDSQNSTFTPWYLLRGEFSSLELKLLSSQLQRLRCEEAVLSKKD